MANLVIQSGPAKGRSFELTGESQCLGREGDIQILDTSASRKHAEVFTLGDLLLIRDLGSRNGTYVNGKKIDKETALRPGDRIRIGSSTLAFEETRPSEHAVEFINDEDTVAAAVEIKLGDKAAEVVAGGKEPADQSTLGRLFTMYEVARILGSETTLRGVVEKVLGLATTAARPTYCYIFIRDEASGNLKPEVWRDPMQIKRRRVSKSIVVRAMQLRHSILTADAAADERFNQSDSVVIGEVRSVICAPLIARDHINGVIYMGRDSLEDPFTDDDLALVTGIAFQTGIALENVASHTERRTELLSLAKTLVGAMDLRSPEQRGHGERVAAYAAAVADRLRLADDECEEVYVAALLHDVGKVPITEATRLAVGAALGVTVQEQFCHAYLGARALEGMPGFANVLPGIRSHHERLDGFGGPQGVSGEAVPLIARIVSVANRFDHLVTDPLHHGQPLPMNEALDAIEQPGEGLDDTITHALVEAQTTGSGIQLPKLVLQEFC